MWLDGWFGKKGTQANEAMAAADPGLRRGADGRLQPRRAGAGGSGNGGFRGPQAEALLNEEAAFDDPQPPGRATPDTSALNKQIVQAVQFTNTETASYATELVATPPEMMVSNATGLAIQDAANYMNGIMQIALAAQAVAIKKAAEGPIQAVEEIPLMAEIQKMVSAAVSVYGDVSSTAGASAKTVISDLKSA